MPTRAAQIELLLDPVIDPTTGSLCSGYTAYFYAAGTSTAKNVWTELEKTNPFTSYSLGSGATALLYGDGIYKIVIENTDGTAVITRDNIKIQATTFCSRAVVGTAIASPDDDVLYCNGTFTVTIGSATYPTVASFSQPLTIRNTGVGTITVDPYGSITIDSEATVSVSAAGTLTIYPDADANIWRRVLDASLDLNGVEMVLDADGDTSITADTDDQIDIKINGTDTFEFDATEFTAPQVKTDTIVEKTSANGVTIDGLSIKDGKLNTANAVTESHITDLSVTTGKIVDDAITTVKILDSAITDGKIANTAVTEAKLYAKAVTNGKIGDAAVNGLQIAYGLLHFFNDQGAGTEWTESGNTWATVQTIGVFKPAGLDKLRFSARVKYTGTPTGPSFRLYYDGSHYSDAVVAENDSYAWQQDAAAWDISGLPDNQTVGIQLQLKVVSGTGSIENTGLILYNG